MKIYVIAHTWNGLELTIEYFSTPEKTVKRIGEITTSYWDEKPLPDDDPEEYLSRYYDNERCNYDSEVVIELKIIDVLATEKLN